MVSVLGLVAFVLWTLVVFVVGAVIAADSGLKVTTDAQRDPYTVGQRKLQW